MFIFSRNFWFSYLTTFLLLFTAVSPATADTVNNTKNTAQAQPSSQDGNSETTLRKTNDLEDIFKRGELRIIVPVNFDGGEFLPRFASPVTHQQQIAQDFAKSLGLKPVIIPVPGMKEQFSTLLSGKGDLIASNITITEKRKKILQFSAPIDHVHEVVLVKADNKDIRTNKNLARKSLLVHPSSSFWDTAQQLQKNHPDITLIKQANHLQDEDALDLVADGEYDATIRDSNIAAMYLSYRDDLKVAFRLRGEKAIAWAIRPDADELKAALDQYLNHVKLSEIHTENQFGDLDKIRKRGVLRILLKNNSASYFFWKGQLMGFEYEMAQAYAKELGVKLAVVVPPENALMLDWLKQGKADIAAGFLTPTKEWSDSFIAASIPYHKAAHHLVVAANNKEINTIEGLSGHTVVVQKSSVYWDVLNQLKQAGVNLTLQAAPETMEIEEILAKVGTGEYESTLVDEHLLDIELGAGVPVKSAFTVGQAHEHALAIRDSDTYLLKSVNAYIKKQKDGKLYARLYRKYFDNSKSISRLQRNRLKEIDGNKSLSDYDRYVKTYASKYGFDWRLITAQMYSESRFRPNIRSSAGAIGLMQVMTNTGHQVRLKKLTDPETNIHAGVKYMHWLSKKFEPDLPIADRTWFTLAAYNAGLGHVLDARRLATKLGLNKDRWFGNVEKAMLLLSKKHYYRNARYGYVRGREPVGYVRKIKNLYENYLNVVNADEIAMQYQVAPLLASK